MNEFIELTEFDTNQKLLIIVKMISDVFPMCCGTAVFVNRFYISTKRRTFIRVKESIDEIKAKLSVL